MAITREEVLKIADLAKLRFSEEELDTFVVQFQHILDYIEQLKQVDVENVPPTSHVSLTPDFEKHMFREDEVQPSLPVEESLADARTTVRDTFAYPKLSDLDGRHESQRCSSNTGCSQFRRDHSKEVAAMALRRIEEATGSWAHSLHAIRKRFWNAPAK